jgi:UDP-glucose 4-epimerase
VLEPVNVGWSQAVSLNQLLAEIGTLYGGLPQVTHLPARAGDIRHSRADNSRLQAHYAMPEQTPLREGLRLLLGL